MARGRRTEPEKAVAATVLHDELGSSPREIGRRLDMAEATVRDILSGRNGWARIHDIPWFKEYREIQKQTIHTAIIELQKSALAQIAKGIAKSSAAQATYSFGVLYDKQRLSAGEATEIHEVITRDKVESLEDLNAKLAVAVAHRILAAKVIEVEPEGNGGPGAT